MQVNEYLFHCTHHNAIKRLPADYWQQVINGQLPYPGHENQTIHVAKLQVLSHLGQPHHLNGLHCYSHRLNDYGFVVSTEALNSDNDHSHRLLQGIFSDEAMDDAVMATLLAQLNASTPHSPWQPSPLQMQAMIEQIWQ